MQRWVQSNDQFLAAARHEFAQTADGWLAAYAKVHSDIVVTNEVYNDNTSTQATLESKG